MINNPVSVILIQRLDNNGHGNRYGVFYKENMVNLDLIPKRLLEKIVTDKKTGCWNWIACKNNRGYGKTSFRGNQDLSHRVFWKIINGEIPFGMFICHKCDNPGCVNPEHLFLGTPKDNMQDCVIKDRHNHTNGNKGKLFCKHGHEFTKENTHVNKKGERLCRQCDKDWHNKYYDPKTQTSHRQQ
jgi:hypothetical protein